jgi:hypothetical protein
MQPAATQNHRRTQNAAACTIRWLLLKQEDPIASSKKEKSPPHISNPKKANLDIPKQSLRLAEYLSLYHWTKFINSECNHTLI